MYSSIDTVAPTVICPSTETIETALHQSTPMVLWPEASDNSRIAPTVICTENEVKDEIGEIEFVCKALDQAGNEATCSIIVDVQVVCKC